MAYTSQRPALANLSFSELHGPEIRKCCEMYQAARCTTHVAQPAILEWDTQPRAKDKRIAVVRHALCSMDPGLTQGARYYTNYVATRRAVILRALALDRACLEGLDSLSPPLEVVYARTSSSEKPRPDLQIRESMCPPSHQVKDMT
jgi:hypothetical protein